MIKNRHKQITNQLLIILAVIVPIIWLTVFVLKNNKNKEILIQPARSVFKSTDKLIFYLDISNQPVLSAIYNPIQSVMAQETQENIYTEENLVIKANIINKSVRTTLPIPLNIQKQEENKFVITADTLYYDIIPGKYNIEVEITRSGENTIVSQDFSWGVLALNTNKGVYVLEDSADISMAVLNDLGDMVCDALVNLEIIDPNNNTFVLSTQDNTINVSPNCSRKEYIEEPDYSTSYKFENIGTYKFTLTAITVNGSYSISENIDVVEYIPFDIQRKTATRIYPPVSYPMQINIKANEDFEGTIIETIPSQFDVISSSTGSVSRIFGVTDTNKAGLVQQITIVSDNNPMSENIELGKKTLSWDVNLKKGEEYQITYVYKAPEISPEFYLIGPITMTKNNQIIFSEKRTWQIASDAVAYVNNDPDTSNNGTSIASSLSVTSGNLLVVFCTTRTSRTISFSGSGYTSVYANSGTPTLYSWYKIATTTGTESPGCSWTTRDGGVMILAEYSGVETTTGYILDTSNTASGSGDASAECPSVTPSSGNHLYVSGLGFAANSSISTWSNSFNERQDINSGPANPIIGALADKSSTGTQSTVATAGATGAWRCDTLAFNENFDRFIGRVFTDDNESSALGPVSVCAVVNANTPQCLNNDSSGYFTFSDLGQDALSGDELTFYIDGGTYLANTKSVSDGGDIISSDNLRLYQNHVVIRDDSGAGIRIQDLDLYDNDQNSTDMLYDAETSPNVLSVETPYELFVQSGYTFKTQGNVTSVHDIEVDGIWTSNTGDTVAISGTYKLDLGGTLNPSTSTVTFNGTGGTEDVITDGTGSFYNLTLNDGGNNLTLEIEDPISIKNTLTITGGTLDIKSAENNQINVGNWDNDDTFNAQNGTVYFDGTGTGTFTIDSDGNGNDAFWNVTFNDSGGANNATYQLTTTLDVDNDLTITGGSLNSNSNPIYIGRNWTNSDTFVEGTQTVYFDGDLASTIDSGCSDVGTCTNQNFYNINLNKDRSLTISNTGLRLSNTLTLTSGELIQTTTNLRAEGATAIYIEEPGKWANLSSGDIYLGGNLFNAGVITFNANGYACGDADDITLTSTAGQRTWSGTGAVRITDVNVSYQTGSQVIHASSSTDGGNNGANWIFLECNLFEFNGLNFDGININ